MVAGDAGSCTLLPVPVISRGNGQGKGKCNAGTKGEKGSGSGKGATDTPVGGSESNFGRGAASTSRPCDEPVARATASRSERPSLCLGHGKA